MCLVKPLCSLTPKLRKISGIDLLVINVPWPLTVLISFLFLMHEQSLRD